MGRATAQLRAGTLNPPLNAMLATNTWWVSATLLPTLQILRHPTPPPLILIEELENGFDPRTIQLIVEEIRKVVKSGKTQIIF